MQRADRDIEVVRAFLDKSPSALSEGDVAAGTGLDVGSVKTALYALMRQYRCKLAVHDDGTLVYDFGPSLEPLHAKSWRDHLRSIGRWLWRGFSIVYKASLAVVLVLYAVVFVALIIAAAIAASSASKDEGPAEGAFRLVGAIFRAIFEFATHSAVIYSDVDRYGYPYAHYEPTPPVLPRRTPVEHEKSFVASVYDFVLGPERVEPGDRAQHKEVAAFVRQNGGVLTVSDVQTLSGMNRSDAESFFASFVAEQDGSAEITEEGVLYATFEELMRSRSQAFDAPIIHYWDEYEAPHELNGNTVGKNFLIGGLALFNLACAGSISTGMSALGDAGLALGIVPLVMFSLFFLVPLLRAPYVWWKNREQHMHNIRKRLFRAIFEGHETELTEATVLRRANQFARSEELLRLEDIGPLLTETLDELGAERHVDAQGALAADMRRLRIESTVVNEHAVAAEEAAIVYETEASEAERMRR